MFKNNNKIKYSIVTAITIFTIIFIKAIFFNEAKVKATSPPITYYHDGDYSYLTEKETELLAGFKNKTIILGVPKYGSFSNLSMEEYEKGVSFLYKELLEKHLGLNVSLYYGEWEELIQNLFEGKIDLLTGVTPTVERKKYIDFTVSYSPDYDALVIPEGHQKIDSLNQLEGKNIYVRKKSHHEDIINSKKRALGFTSSSVAQFDYDLVDNDSFIFTTDEVITDIIKKGKKGLKINNISQESPVVVGISRDTNILFQNIIKKSMKEVFHNHLISYVENLRWELKKSLLKLNLTPEERDYLKRKKKLNIRFEDEFFPHTFYDEATNEYKGVEVEIIQQISDFIDIPVNIINLDKDNRKNKDKNLNSEKEDFTIAFKTPENEKKFLFTKNTSIEDIVLITESDKIEGFLNKINRLNYKIGVIDNSIFHRIAKNYYNEENIVPAEDTDHLMKLREDDKINFILTDRGTLTYYQNYRLEGDLIIYDHFTSIPLALGIDTTGSSSDEMQEKLLLKGIFDKTINFCIDTESKYTRWLSFGIDIEGQLENKNNLLLLFFGITLMGCAKLYVNNKMIKKQKDNLYNLLYYDQEINCRNRTFYERDIDLFITQGVEGGAITYTIEGIYELSSIYGYKEIDAAFKKGADNVKKVIGDKGFLYRMNKVEFIVILPEITHDEIRRVGGKIYKRLTAPNIIKKEDHKNIKVSLGVAPGSRGKTISAAVRESQMAKHLARMEKKKNIVIAGDDIHERFNRESQMKESVLEALRRREFTPFFQIKKDLKKGNIYGCEALARWVDSSGKITPPGAFIPLMENLGLIATLDLQIFEKSLIQLRSWIDDRVIQRDFKLSFNLSIDTLEKEDILRDIEYFMDKYKIDGSYLEAEVTETTFIKSEKKINSVLKGLKDLGIGLNIDDFSAGHSSANYLIDFKFDMVKLDRGLLPASEEDVSKIKIYKAFVEMIRELGIISVCEGVEPPFHEQLVLSLGVDIGQGYYYNKPQPADEVELLFLKG